VRNADDWPVGPQIGHSAVKRLDDSIQAEFNVLTEQWQRGLYNVKRSIAFVNGELRTELPNSTFTVLITQ